MEMKRIEAETLEEAYSKAAKELNCSVTQINYEIVQYPTTGMMGLFKKTAIIIAVKKITTETKSEVSKKVDTSKAEEKQEIKKLKEEVFEKVSEEKPSINSNITKKPKQNIEVKKEAIVDDFFNTDGDSSKKQEIKKQEVKKEKVATTVRKNIAFEDDRDTPENKKLSLEIEQKIQNLMKAGCFEVDTVEVDVFNGIAHIFIDGDDAALLIGKEGYRYNALSYMFFNWINAQYNLYIKLEIAEFIQAQEEMIDSYLKPIAEHIKEHGKGKTKPLDGILVQIALEKLRAMFPNKYIAIKRGKDGKKFIIINDFNTRKK